MSEPRLTLIVVPDGGEDSRTYQISYRRLRVLRAASVAAGIVLLTIVASWAYMAARTVRMAELEAELAIARADQARMPLLAEQLAELESRYAHIRHLFGPDEAAPPGELWLPPAGGGRAGARRDADQAASVPDSWPLSERGFITQGRFQDDQGGHPGLDIAVPTASYVRASGAGVVSDVGEDVTYGRFVRIDHGNGYETLYAHASELLVSLGEPVRKNEVIALSGSTGQSTAPHLHFEIIRQGILVDPLDLVTQP